MGIGRSSLSVCLACCLLVASGLGYTRQYVDDDQKIPIRWKQKTIAIGLSDSLLKFGSRKEVLEIAEEAFRAWGEEAGLNFRFRFVKSKNVSSLGSVGDGVSLITVAPTGRNKALFRGTEQQKNSAVTRLFYTGAGVIREADIVLNPGAKFSQSAKSGTFDLQSTLTHEAGHFLGLDHSTIAGSSMHRHQSLNGLFAQPATYARTLSVDDEVGIKAHYDSFGKRSGTIEGKLANENYRIERDRHVWLENPVDGSIVAGAKVGKDGHFEISGVPEGTYRLYASFLNGDAISNEGKTVTIRARTSSKLSIEAHDYSPFSFDATVGFNSQLGSVAMPIQPGQKYVLSLSGTDLYSRSLWFESSSPFIGFVEDSVHKRFSDGVKDVVGVTVETEESLSPGVYSLRIYDSGTLISNLAGHLTVE